jgi:hypothetical protein
MRTVHYLFLVLHSHCCVPEPLRQCVDLVVQTRRLDLVVRLREKTIKVN